MDTKVLFPKSSFVEAFVPSWKYDDYIREEIIRYTDDGLIKDLAELKRNSNLFWDEEKKMTRPHPMITRLIDNKSTVLDDFVQSVLSNTKLSNIQFGKKVQKLKTIEKQLVCYLKAVQEEECGTQVFTKLYRMQNDKPCTKNSQDMSEWQLRNWSAERNNSYVKRTKDFKSDYFTTIEGFRKEIEDTLKEIVKIIVIGVLYNDRQNECISFGSIHIFQWYLNKTRECIAKLNKTLFEKVEITQGKYTCSCGSIIYHKSGKAHHEQTRKHINFLKGNGVLCDVVEKTDASDDTITAEVVNNRITK
jgi:hypothetical protein